MPKKETIEGLAKAEADQERIRAETKAQFQANQLELAKHMPNRFFSLATELREGVVRFNTACDPQRRISWRESTALAARDSNLNADFNCSLSRDGGEITMGLTSLGRSGKPDAYLIEINGNYPKDYFMLRVDGSFKNGKPSYRLSLNFKRLEYDIDELADRLVKSLVKLSLVEVTKLYLGD